MKKKGFTLIELLAVIVILAIIALIATPMIMDVIEKARKSAAIDSVNGLLETAEQYQYESMLDGVEPSKTIDLTSDLLKHKGAKPDSGTLIIGENGKMHIIAKYGKYCIEKGFEDISPEVVDKEECTMELTKVYGIKRSLTTESSAWERIDDAVGLVANAQVGTTSVQNDFDSIYPWSDIKSYNYNTDTKTITAWYGDDNFTFTPASTSNVEVLTYIPEFYYKKVQEDGYEYIYISKENQEGYSKNEAFSVGRYTISGDTTRVHSRSGYLPLTRHTITEFRDYARNLGEEFGQLDYHYFILQLLYLVEYADYNSQAKLGPGVTNTDAFVTSGGCDVLGMHSGSVDGTDKTSIIYRGIEDIFGNIFQFVDGINTKDYQTYICYNQREYESDKFDGCYQPLGYVNSNKEGYISKLGYDINHPLMAFPIETNGSNNKYITDEYWLHSGNTIVRAGGDWRRTTQCGLWHLSFYDISSISYINVGARLLKIN